MKKYAISNDFRFVKFLTFPVVAIFGPIAEPILGVGLKVPHSDRNVKVKKYKIPVQGGKIDALLYEPKNTKDKLPILVYYHGGGFIYRAAPYHYRLVKDYCRLGDCKVLMVDYRVTPRHVFPVQTEDCYAALKWVVENAESLVIDKSRIAIGGDSAGGCLCAATGLMNRDRGLTKLCGQMLVYPVADRRMITDSMKKFTDTPVWNSVLSAKMWKLYLTDKNVEHIGYASPAEASAFSNLPTAYVETAEFDALHDEGINFANSLENAGVPVTIKTSATMHGFDMAGKSEIVKKSVEARTAFLRKIFE